MNLALTYIIVHIIAGCQLQGKREYLCIFGDLPYKDRNTQIITCPKCHHKVSPEYVVKAITAMRFIDKVLENREVEQVDFNFFFWRNDIHPTIMVENFMRIDIKILVDIVFV